MQEEFLWRDGNETGQHLLGSRPPEDIVHSLVGAPPKGHAVSLQGWEGEKRSVLHVESRQDKTSQVGTTTRKILSGQK